MAMLVGEWGAFYLNPAAVEPTRYILRQIEGVESGDMFWAYRRELADWPGLEALKKHGARN
jgi:hypothetical protein